MRARAGFSFFFLLFLPLFLLSFLSSFTTFIFGRSSVVQPLPLNESAFSKGLKWIARSAGCCAPLSTSTSFGR